MDYHLYVVYCFVTSHQILYQAFHQKVLSKHPLIIMSLISRADCFDILLLFAS